MANSKVRFMNSGYFYCPYVPLSTTPVTYNDDVTPISKVTSVNEPVNWLEEGF